MSCVCTSGPVTWAGHTQPQPLQSNAVQCLGRTWTMPLGSIPWRGMNLARKAAGLPTALFQSGPCQLAMMGDSAQLRTCSHSVSQPELSDSTQVNDWPQAHMPGGAGHSSGSYCQSGLTLPITRRARTGLHKSRYRGARWSRSTSVQACSRSINLASLPEVGYAAAHGCMAGMQLVERHHTTCLKWEMQPATWV